MGTPTMGSAQLSSKGKTGQSGHFYFAEKRTLLFGVDMLVTLLYPLGLRPRERAAVVIYSKCMASSRLASLKLAALDCF